MRAIWRTSILTRIFVLFSLTLLPTYGLSVIVYNWGTEEVIDKINTSSNAQMNQYMERLEREVERLQAIQYEFMNDRDLTRMSTLWEHLPWQEQYDALRGLKQRVHLIQNSSAYVGDVRIYLTGAQRVISTGGGVSPLPDVSFLMIERTDAATDRWIDYRDGGLYVDFHRVLPGLSEPTLPVFTISIRLDPSIIQQELEVYGDEDINLLLTDTEGGAMIASSGVDDDNRAAIMAEMQHLHDRLQPAVTQVTIGQSTYSALTVYSDNLGMTWIKFLREGHYTDSLQKYTVWIWGFTILSLLAISLFTISTYRMLYRPLSKLSSAFKRVESGNLTVRIDDAAKHEFDFIYRSFNRMVGELQVLIKQIYQQKLLAQRAQMKQLQSQINPHFLYNNFQILYRMAKLEDQQELAELSIKLSQYYQYVTRNTRDNVPLAQEVEFARMYVDIQLIRFQHRLSVQFDELPEGWGHHMVPRLILQPILENAFEHGLQEKAATGLLRVAFSVSEQHLTISIEDNGEALTPDTLSALHYQLETDSGADVEVTALVNIHRRLRISQGADSGISVGRGERGGLRVEICLTKEAKGSV